MSDKSWLVAGVFLFYCMYCDLRCGMISVKSCLLAAGAGIVARMQPILCGCFMQEALTQETAPEVMIWSECVPGVLPGIALMGLAIGSGERIGKGDAWIMLALGILVGPGRCTSLFVIALFLTLPFAAIWLWGRRRMYMRRQLQFGPWTDQWVPFAPSLFFAYVILSLVR